MKKIAFFVQWMLCGGVENALITLTEELVDRGNMVTIYLIKKKGDFLEKVSPKVDLLEIPMDSRLRESIPVGGTKVSVRNKLSKREYFRAIDFLIRHKIGKTEFAELNINLNKVPQLNEQYDIAVNFHMHSPFLVWYLAERVQAEKKYTWIHNDFKTTKYNISKLKSELDKNNAFFGVSKEIVEEFNQCIPEYKSKTYVAHNLIPYNKILKMSEEYYPEEFLNIEKNRIKILTVGRLEEQKGYDFAIDIAEKLKRNSISYKWFVIGEGSLRKSLVKEIKKRNLEDYIILLGRKINPYPYFKYCDLYIQTSKHEGWGITLTEAKLFCKPIVTTRFAGAEEQIEDGVNGEISDINIEKLYSKVEDIILNKDKRMKYSKNLSMGMMINEDYWLEVFK